jgi:hypothetical protein
MKRKLYYNKIKTNLNLRVATLSKMDKRTPTNRINPTKEQGRQCGHNVKLWRVRLVSVPPRLF